MSIVSADWTVGCVWLDYISSLDYMMHVFMLYLPLASVLLWRLWLNQDNNGGNSALCVVVEAVVTWYWLVGNGVDGSCLLSWPLLAISHSEVGLEKSEEISAAATPIDAPTNFPARSEVVRRGQISAQIFWA